jgi:D-alanyl-lipoteichoic acid acyltransferase DltB (MBOAT superfamily)
MLFNSFGYLVFFLPAIVAAFWLCPQRLRPALLLIASYGFYMSWKPIYGLLIFGLSLGNYILGLVIGRSKHHRKWWLTAAIALNLLTLGVFKYAYFARNTANSIASLFHFQVPDIAMQIILPLGISFFVFEFIHYVCDVYEGSKPISSFFDLALFASFFPTQIAGPIKRYQDFIPQLYKKSVFNFATFQQGISLILFGLFKKVVFADNLAPVAQAAFEHPQLLSSVDLWLAVYAFAFQIYFDFSGYTDIARGSALLFGYKVPINFNLPYLASSISDFWRRWHISLSTWLRDYLFIPLGGSRGSRMVTYRNLFITMALGGLWHGAAAHFVMWGCYQGVMLILHKEFQRVTDGQQIWNHIKSTTAFKVASIVFTFQIVCIGWVFFRASDMGASLSIIKKLLFLPDPHSALAPFALSITSINSPIVFLILPAILLLLFAGQLIGWLQEKFKDKLALPSPLEAAWMAAIVCVLMVFSPDTSPRFIYFQF